MAEENEGRTVMKYPTMEEVEAADQTQLCRWYRFLPSPGPVVVGQENAASNREVEILNRIIDRHKEGGGFTPEISKAIGW